MKLPKRLTPRRIGEEIRSFSRSFKLLEVGVQRATVVEQGTTILKKGTTVYVIAKNDRGSCLIYNSTLNIVQITEMKYLKIRKEV